MLNTTDNAWNESDGGGLLPISPFKALQVHFGMLLGVEDIELVQANPRGKLRLHNAWLHGLGVVWGLGVRWNARRELQVSPGLALDGAGRELYLDGAACLDLGQWFEKNHADTAFDFKDAAAGDGKMFSALVVARFRACLARPVPAIASSCEGSSAEMAYSRADESVELLLRPLPTGPAGPPPYLRLRILFQIADDRPELDDVRLRRVAIQALPVAEQPRAFLSALRQLAALDEIDLQPQHASAERRASIFPEDPSEVVLAELRDIVVRPSEAEAWTVAYPPPAPNVQIRKVLLPTATIQELLAGPLLGWPGVAPPPLPPVDAGGPRVDPGSVVLGAKVISMQVTGTLEATSVALEGFAVTAFSAADGWVEVDLKKTSFDAGTSTLTIDLKEALEPSLVRVIARGTGPRPLMGTNQVPLAGAVGGPPVAGPDGLDFVFVGKRS